MRLRVLSSLALTSVTALLLAAQSAAAQPSATSRLASADTIYTPRYVLPDGPQLLVVYVGNSAAGTLPELSAAVRRMKPLLAQQATSRGKALSIAGVALDWMPDSGYVYLKSLGNWDEMVTGNNWVSLAAVDLIWHDRGVKPSLPQVLVYERTVHPAGSAIAVSPRRLLRSITGIEDIIRWVDGGAQLPAAKSVPRKPGM
jgi:hypothetical protein